MSWSQIRPVVATAVLIALGACDSDERPRYDVTVGWSVGGLSVCRSALPDGFSQSEIVFETMEITVYEDEDRTQKVEGPVVVPCTEESAVIERLDRGTYTVEVAAVGDYQGEMLPFFSGVQEVKLGAEDAFVTVPLSVSPGSVTVVWRFDGGLVCGVATPGEVADVVVTVGDRTYTASCGDGKLRVDDLPVEPVVVTAVAQDADGQELYRSAEQTVVLLPGKDVSVDVEFAP